MPILILLAVMSNVPPTAADAYRANLNSVKAKADYQYKHGVHDWDYSNRHFKSPIRGADPVDKPTFVVDGSWGHDGKVERFLIPAENAVLNKQFRTNDPFEILFDGETYAFVDGKRRRFDVSVTRTSTLPLNVIGPFEWWSSPLSQILATEYPGALPKAENKAWMDVPCKYISYANPRADTWEKLELYFDPAWNFVPRFGRIAAFAGGNDTLYIKDVIVVDVARCQAGGFFPKEWYYRSFQVSRMSRVQPGFSAESDSIDLVADNIGVVFGHFKVKSYRDTTAPVCLHLGDEITVIGSQGGTVPLNSRNPTLQDLTGRLGRKIDGPPAVPKLNIDESERNDRQPRASVFPYRIIFVGVVSLTSLLLLFRRIRARRSISLCILAAFTATGCGSKGDAAPKISEDAAPKISVHFSKPLRLCEPTEQSIQDELIVENRSNQALRVSAIDGGCSCRSFDKSAFPFELRPDESRRVPISMSRKNDYEAQAIAFQVTTSEGVLVAPATIRIVPRMKILTESSTAFLNGLVEGQPSEDRVTIRVRAVQETGRPPTAYSIAASPGLRVIQPAMDDVSEASLGPDLRYTERAYQVAIEDQSPGVAKGLVQLVGQDGQTLSESTIIWQRRAFLSASPSKVLLGEHQVRILLSSQDERTTYTKVREAPSGVSAVLASPRELVVARDKDQASKRDGQIRVETDDKDHPVLTIDLMHL